MPFGTESIRVAIAGATSLQGKDLKKYMEECGFPSGEVRLFDEELTAGTLTDFGGEPTVVQPIDEASFERVRFVFFAGSAGFSAKHAQAALNAGATVIDLSGGLSEMQGARLWIPALDAVLPPPPPCPRIEVCVSPSAPAIVASAFSAAMEAFSPARMALVFLHPVSERGQAGVAELEAQTVKLLSLQAIPQEVFGEQVAFNLLGRWGPESKETLSEARQRIEADTAKYLGGGRGAIPAMTLVQAPVFFGYGFSAYAEFVEPPAQEAILGRLRDAGFHIAAEDDPGPSNLVAAGETKASIRLSHRDRNIRGGFWFWGAADNLRLRSANAMDIAERLLAS